MNISAVKKGLWVAAGYNALSLYSLLLSHILERPLSNIIWILFLTLAGVSMLFVYWLFTYTGNKAAIESHEKFYKRTTWLPYLGTFTLYLLHFLIFLAGVIYENPQPVEIAEAFMLAMLMGAYLFFGFEYAAFDFRESLHQVRLRRPFPRLWYKIAVTFIVFTFLPLLFIVFKIFYLLEIENGEPQNIFLTSLVTMLRTVVISLFAGGFLAYTIIKPVQTLARATDQIIAADYSGYVPVYNNDETGVLTSGFNDMLSGMRERERIRSVFDKYISGNAADAILSGKDRLGGNEKNLTVLFSDIRNFTSLSETYSPEKVVENLNRYYSAAVPAIEKYGGFVNKYIGDAILAVFGAFESETITANPHFTHADQAIAAASEMLKSLEKFNHENTRLKLPAIEIGIGIDTGPVILGNIGSETRMEYTVIGDTVNTASRIEGFTKKVGASILISQNTLNQSKLKDEKLNSWQIKAKGKSKPVKVFSLEKSAMGQLKFFKETALLMQQVSKNIMIDTPMKITRKMTGTLK